MNGAQASLIEKIVAVHDALDRAQVPHAFGGALALAWCTGRARGTIDIDINVFAPTQQSESVARALPPDVAWSAADVAALQREGQKRLWWGPTPVDVFLNTTAFHEQAMFRVARYRFAERDMPFLGCSDLAVFKCFFNRTKDWADIEDMLSFGSLDTDRVVGVLVHYLGADDQRVARLLSLVGRPAG